MKNLISLSFALALLGCANGNSEGSSASNSAEPSGVTQPVTNDTPKPPSESSPSKPPLDQKAPTSKASDNPNRLFQLKDLKKIKARANGHSFNLWVMDDPAKRQEGMMWLENKEVKDDEGMVFVFPRAEPLSFWMENTILPLDIIYVSSDKRVLNIQPGKAFDQTSLPSEGPALYVVELKLGTAKRTGIKKGTRFEFSPEVKAEK